MDENNNSLQHLPFSAVSFMALLCLVWGGNLVSIKVSNQGIPPILGAAMRSVFASAILWIYARWTGRQFFLQRDYLAHGAAIGFLFAMSFLFLYWGLVFTDVSRSVIFIYTHPFWVAIAAHFVLPNERLTWMKIGGMFVAFAGLILAFGAKSSTLGPLYWLGDLMVLVSAMFWAASMVYLKKFIWNRSITHFETLSAQLLFSIPVLAAGSLILEHHQTLSPGILVISAFVYQVVIVAVLSYLLWFWLIHRYPVSRLAAFTFLAPLFGALLGSLLLNETIVFRLYLGLAFVAGGLYLVNKPEAA